jgi:hypothetical protein
MVSTTNLVSYYKFDNNGTDSHGSNDATINGATYDAGIINNAISFDGSNDYADINGVTLTATSNKTFNHWIDTTDTAAYILDSNDSGDRFILGIESGVYKHYDDASWKSTGISPSAGLQMLSWVFSNSGATLDFYVNAVHQTTITVNPQPVKINTALGSDSNGTSTFLQGDIDEMGIFNEALSQSDLTALYNSGSGLAYPFSIPSSGIKINGVECNKFNGVNI